MRIVMFAILALPLAAPASAQQRHPLRSTVTGERCVPASDVVRVRKGGAPEKLGEQPPATRLYALYNLVEGCSQPIVLDDRIAANPERTLPMMRVPAQPRALRRPD